jgi:hypothetical protein
MIALDGLLIADSAWTWAVSFTAFFCSVLALAIGVIAPRHLPERFLDSARGKQIVHRCRTWGLAGLIVSTPLTIALSHVDGRLLAGLVVSGVLIVLIEVTLLLKRGTTPN